MSTNVPEFLSAVLYGSPQKAITYTWLISLVLLFSTFLVMCVAVSHMSGGHHDRVTAFAGAWSTLLFIIVSVVGTYFMSRFKSTYSIGIFAGVVFVMSNQMLFVMAMFVERVKDNSEEHEQDHSDDAAQADSSESAMAAFCFFMFTIYAIFASLLVLLRDKIGSAASPSVSDRHRDIQEVEEEDRASF